MKIAVVGAGISGLTAAYRLRSTHAITLFERERRFGGHSHTHDVPDSRGTLAVDSGFIVHNDRTYPLLQQLFSELDIETHPTEMSMSICCTGCGLEFAGGKKFPGLFAQKSRLFDARHLRLLYDVTRFQRAARELLTTGDENLTLGEFVAQNGWNDHFVQHYVIPVVACVWSTGTDRALDYPALYLFRFLSHHGFLGIKGSPQWYTVVGGSRSYVSAISERLHDNRAETQIISVTRHESGVTITDHRGTPYEFDAIVIATHADEALAMLTDATPAEKRVLGAFEYSVNETQLHHDAGPVMPTTPNAQASWNYRMSACAQETAAPVVTYWMNRLHGIESDRPLLVTLNGSAAIDPDSVVATMQYTHPIYTNDSVAAQHELPTLNTERTVFAGAYHGWGFHEDGCRSGYAAAEHILSGA